MIEGIKQFDLKTFSDERGKVFHFMKEGSESYFPHQEVYFSTVNPQKIKGWKKHLKMVQNFVVPMGKIKLVIFDDRENSKSVGKVQELIIGEDQYQMIRIPAGVWYAFQGMSSSPALLANCASIIHDPSESITMDLNSSVIPYKW